VKLKRIHFCHKFITNLLLNDERRVRSQQLCACYTQASERQNFYIENACTISK